MTKENFYLELLQEQVNLLNVTIKHKDDYSLRSYHCILAGIVIRMNTVLEECLLHFHSDKFDQVSELIYTCRQICVHYSSFMDFKDIEKQSMKIIEAFNKAYPNEKQYFAKMLNTKYVKPDNIVIGADKKIKYDAYTHTYFADIGDQRIMIDANNITRIQDFRKKKNLAYIIDLSESISVRKNVDGKFVFEEISNRTEMVNLFTHNFVVQHENYDGHIKLISDVLENFYKDNYHGIYVQEKLELDDERKPDYILSSRLLDRYFRDGVVYQQFLGDHLFTNMSKPSYEFYDYKNIRKHAKENLENNLSAQDFFLITKGISGFDLIRTSINKNDCLMNEQKMALQSSLLIHWLDASIRHLSESFVEADPDFKKAYLKLLKYRAFFAHNPLQLKGESEKIMSDFYELSEGVMSILTSLDFSKITKKTDPKLIKFAEIERNSDNFITFNGEQYLKINDKDYLGNRLFYSSRETVDKKVVGLMPIDKHYPNRVAYYTRGEVGFMRQKAGKKRRTKFLTASDDCVDDVIYFDTELTTLLDVYANSRGRGDERISKNSDKQVVLFTPSESNNYKAHAILLDNIISDYYKLRYLPIELAQELSFEIVFEDNKPVFIIKNSNGATIARAMSYNNFRKDCDLVLDSSNDIIVNEVISVRKGRAK